MALADYKLCDKCFGKCFYDADLNYVSSRDRREWDTGPNVKGTDYLLGNLGDWAVLCSKCSEQFECVVIEKPKAANGE